MQGRNLLINGIVLNPELSSPVTKVTGVMWFHYSIHNSVRGTATMTLFLLLVTAAELFQATPNPLVTVLKLTSTAIYTRRYYFVYNNVLTVYMLLDKH